MAILSLLASALPGAIKSGYSLLNKPKKTDFSNPIVENALQRQIANLESDIVSKNVAHSLSRPAIRRSAMEREDAKREISGMDLSPTAQAEANIKLTSKTQENVSDIMDKANYQQLTANQDAKQRLSEANMMLANIKQQSENQFNQAKDQRMGNIVSGFAESLNPILTGIEDIQERQAFQGMIDPIMQRVQSNQISMEDGIDQLIFQILGGQNG